VNTTLLFAMTSSAGNVRSQPRIMLSNNATCDLSTGKTFRVRGLGFTPGTQTQEVVFYPNGRVYTYIAKQGVYQVAGAGNFATHLWDCLNGPNGKPDPAGTYTIVFVDSSGRSAVSHFKDIKQ
jgi:hypothetical protein